jgi:hypothetical protein
MRFINDNIWTWAGTAIALISMSGVVQSQALLISGIAVGLQVILAFILRDED